METYYPDVVAVKDRNVNTGVVTTYAFSRHFNYQIAIKWWGNTLVFDLGILADDA